MAREVDAVYTDPLDLVWLNTARAMGLRVVRSADAYASTNGRGTLSLATPEAMDADDCLAQMIFHEICHWMVQGRAALGWVDWGLDNEGTRDVEREHACLRLQAALLQPFGLRQALAPTTDFRIYYDALPEDPFEERDERDRLSITLARAAYDRRRQTPFRDGLEAALDATATIFATVKNISGKTGPSNHLAFRLQPPLPRHVTGLPMYESPRSVCGKCAWYFESDTFSRGRCRQEPESRTERNEPSCCAFEPAFDCRDCGACCREAYDTVEVDVEDPACRLHLTLMVERSGGYDMRRKGSRCACLQGGVELTPPQPTISGGIAPKDAALHLPPLNMPSHAPFTCSIYETRPETCRQFTIFSDHCLHARRRVGLSR